LIDATFDDETASIRDKVNAPGIAVGISERHRDIGHDIEFGGASDFGDRLQDVHGLFRSLILITAQEFRGDGIGEAERLHSAGGDGALCAFFIDDDGDQFDVAGGFEESEHFFGVGHLRDCGGRDEADGIDVGEAGGDEFAQVVRLLLRGDLCGKALPGIARTFNDFDGIAHEFFVD